MPKGQYDRSAMKKPVASSAQPAAVLDAACLVYKDRAGVKLGGGPTEGASYAGTIANEARKGLEDVPEVPRETEQAGEAVEA